jgi:hypothetical protein
MMEAFESSRSSLVPVAGFSEATYLDGAPSAPSNTTPTPEAFYWPDKTTEHSRLSRFGMTSEPLMGVRGEDLLTWFREVSLAKTSAQRDEAMDWTASEVGSGRKWLGLLAKYDRDSLSWRTPQCSLLEGSDEFSETWPRWGSMRNGESWERQTAAPITSAIESGLWPTPQAHDAQKGYAERVGRFGTKHGGRNLNDEVKMWPTPTVCGNYNRKGLSKSSGDGLATAVKMWPTPCASASKGSSPAALTRKSGKSRENDRIDHAVMASDGGQLNPEWVEWLMGWPIGLTALKPLETDKFREWQQQHSICSHEVKNAA